MDISNLFVPKVFISHLAECLREMLERDPQHRPVVSILRCLFESYCNILNQWIGQTSDTVELIPPYSMWKESIKKDFQDDELSLSDLINWYESNRASEVGFRLLDVLATIPESTNIAGATNKMV